MDTVQGPCSGDGDATLAATREARRAKGGRSQVWFLQDTSRSND